MLTLPPKGKDYELVPADTYVATCYRIIDLGTQMTEFQGVRKAKHQIMLGWELSGSLMEDGRPFTQHRRYNFVGGDKSTLKLDLEAWRGSPFSDDDYGKFDLGKLIGKSCMMGIVHITTPKGTFANMSFIGKMMKGVEAPILINPVMYFSLNEFDKAKYESLSDSLKATIAKSPEYQELMQAHKVDDVPHGDTRSAVIPADLDDEIPF